MVRRANRYFQNLKTKGILSVFRLAKGDYSSRERERALCKRQAAFSWNLLNLLYVRYLELAGLGCLSFPAELQREGRCLPLFFKAFRDRQCRFTRFWPAWILNSGIKQVLWACLPVLCFSPDR